MSGYLLDTNCISEIVRTKPEPRVAQWIDAADESLLYLSAMTLGEIRKSIAGLPQSRHRTLLDGWLEVDLKGRFAGRILPVDAPVAERWGLIAAQARSRGMSLPVVDGLIAATALHHNLTVVSRNASDFRRIEVQVLNPWEA